MTMSRAILLLTCLPVFAPAAPAPFIRERKPADNQGWSKPVDGLRVRLIAHRTRYRAGESVRLLLEIQNVSGSGMTIEEPDLSPIVSASAEAGWSITYSRLGRADRECEKIMRMKRESALRKFAAGATLRVEITTHAGGMLAEKEKKSDSDEEPRRQDVFFSQVDTPGVYELRATFSPRERRGEVDVKGGRWGKNSLTSPPVRIEIQR